MKKYKRLFKKFRRSLIIYITVFVSLINACIFVPMNSFAFDETIYERLPVDSLFHDYQSKFVSSFGSPSTFNEFQSWYYHWYQLTVYCDFSQYMGQRVYFEVVIGLNYSSGNGFGTLDSNSFKCKDSSVSEASLSLSLLAEDSQYDNRLVLSGSFIVDAPVPKIVFDINLEICVSGVGSYNNYVTCPTTFTYIQEDFYTERPELSDSDHLENIDNQTKETNDILDNIQSGYDNSAGNTASGQLSDSLDSYEQAESTLFGDAKESLDGFVFFDLSTYTSVVSALSFVSSMLVSIYNSMGALNGIGIVISVLLSVLLLAIIIGLYRYYK